MKSILAHCCLGIILYFVEEWRYIYVIICFSNHICAMQHWKTFATITIYFNVNLSIIFYKMIHVIVSSRYIYSLQTTYLYWQKVESIYYFLVCIIYHFIIRLYSHTTWRIEFISLVENSGSSYHLKIECVISCAKKRYLDKKERKKEKQNVKKASLICAIILKVIKKCAVDCGENIVD